MYTYSTKKICTEEDLNEVISLEDQNIPKNR